MFKEKVPPAEFVPSAFSSGCVGRLFYKMIKKYQGLLLQSLTVCVSHLQCYWSNTFCPSRVYECFHEH